MAETVITKKPQAPYQVFKETGLVSPNGEQLTVVFAAAEPPTSFTEPAMWVNTTDGSFTFLVEGEWQ